MMKRAFGLARQRIARHSQHRLGGVALLIGLLTAVACGPSPDSTAPTASQPPPAVSSAGSRARQATPSLWRVEAKANSAQGERSTLHLMGSIHVGPEGGWLLAPRVMEAFEAADALVVEVDEAGETDEQQDDLTLSFGLLPIGTTVDQKISPALYQALREHLRESGRPIMGLDQLKPWMIAIALISNEFERLGYSAKYGVDVALIAQAGAVDKPVVALETTRQQLTMLDGMPDAMQELMLQDALLQAAEIESYFRELRTAWQHGNQKRLTRALFAEVEDHPELAPFYETIIFDRNASMRVRLEELLATGGQYFVVVGAAHLAGERGIPSALAARGYGVEAIETKGRP